VCAYARVRLLFVVKIWKADRLLFHMCAGFYHQLVCMYASVDVAQVLCHELLLVCFFSFFCSVYACGVLCMRCRLFAHEKEEEEPPLEIKVPVIH